MWAPWVYGCIASAAAVCLYRPKPLVALFAASVLAFSLTGLRAVQFQSHALDPSLEGRDIAGTGVVAAMPQRSDGGLRFRFDVESPATLPPQIYLGWYGSTATDDAGAMDLASSLPDCTLASAGVLTCG